MSLREKFEADLQDVRQSAIKFKNWLEGQEHALKRCLKHVAGDPPPDEPEPIKVPMRVEDVRGSWMWQMFFVGRWFELNPSGKTGRYVSDKSYAKTFGERILADLSHQLGVPLEADWEDTETNPDG